LSRKYQINKQRGPKLADYSEYYKQLNYITFV